MTDPRVTEDPVDPELYDEPSFGHLPSRLQDGDELLPTADPTTPAGEAYENRMNNTSHTEITIPWDESIDTRIEPIVNEQQGTIEDNGPPMPEII